VGGGAGAAAVFDSGGEGREVARRGGAGLGAVTDALADRLPAGGATDSVAAADVARGPSAEAPSVADDVAEGDAVAVAAASAAVGARAVRRFVTANAPSAPPTSTAAAIAT